MVKSLTRDMSHEFSHDVKMSELFQSLTHTDNSTHSIKVLQGK